MRNARIRLGIGQKAKPDLNLPPHVATARSHLQRVHNAIVVRSVNGDGYQVEWNTRKRTEVEESVGKAVEGAVREMWKGGKGCGGCGLVLRGFERGRRGSTSAGT